MAGLTEESKWENEIYCIEESDPVIGGKDGISNKPQKQLANRTQYLKALTDQLDNTKANRTNDVIKMRTINSDDAENYKYTGFYRPNSGVIDGKTLGSLMMHITHPLFKNAEHARGISFNYGSGADNEAWKLYTTAFNAAGNYIGRKEILTEQHCSSAVDSNSVNSVATSAAVKTAYDKAVSAYNAAAGKVSKAGDTMTGVLRAVDFVMNRNGNQKLSSLFDALIKLAQGDATGFQNIVNTWGNAGTTPLGITYNFTNANAWYICFGPFFGNLIIQGGFYDVFNAKKFIVKLPINVNKIIFATNAQIEGVAEEAPSLHYAWHQSGANNKTEIEFLTNYVSRDTQQWIVIAYS